MRRRTRGACVKGLPASDDLVGVGAAFRQLCRFNQNQRGNAGSAGAAPSGSAVRATFITMASSV